MSGHWRITGRRPTLRSLSRDTEQSQDRKLNLTSTDCKIKINDVSMTQDTFYKLQSSSLGTTLNKTKKSSQRRRGKEEREQMSKFIHSPELFDMIADQRKIGADTREILIK